MLEREIEIALNGLIAKIKESATYKEYQQQLARIKEHPECYQKANEFRQKNYELQNAEQTDDLFEKVEAFDKEYEAFRENPIVDDFLKAELAFCRMIQEITPKIMEKVDFE